MYETSLGTEAVHVGGTGLGYFGRNTFRLGSLVSSGAPTCNGLRVDAFLQVIEVCAIC